MEELEEILGEDVVFDLQGLLVEDFGATLRHFMAHGLLDDGLMQSLDALYFWGLVLRLCVSMLPPPPQPGEEQDVGGKAHS
jgi:hypothetical protein